MLNIQFTLIITVTVNYSFYLAVLLAVVKKRFSLQGLCEDMSHYAVIQGDPFWN